TNHEKGDSLLSLRGAERRSNLGGGRNEIASLRSQRHDTATPAEVGSGGSPDSNLPREASFP
ncbi:MAG: hypothetical protein SVO26_08305, partial [Chloroflexota bacterium]|nr:hypothetical protein [Chloroflexota bacterium]